MGFLRTCFADEERTDQFVTSSLGLIGDFGVTYKQSVQEDLMQEWVQEAITHGRQRGSSKQSRTNAAYAQKVGFQFLVPWSPSVYSAELTRRPSRTFTNKRSTTPHYSPTFAFHLTFPVFFSPGFPLVSTRLAYPHSPPCIVSIHRHPNQHIFRLDWPRSVRPRTIYRR